MDIADMIKVMLHYENGGEVEFRKKYTENAEWSLASPIWNWGDFDYRIKEDKVRITIEKWLCKSGENSFYIHEGTDADGLEKVKLIESYEIEL